MAKAKQYNRYSIQATAIPNQYICSKLDPDFEVVGSYTMVENASGSLHCDCPAYKPWCRHCDILRKFQAEERVGKGWFYIPETNVWLPPMTGDV